MIQLKEILDKNNIPSKEAAAVLFPNNKYPELALSRVLEGRSELSESQVYRLAKILGCPVGALYSQEFWSAQQKGEIVCLQKGQFRAVLDWRAQTTRVYKNGEEIAVEILHSQAVTLREYLQKIENIIHGESND
jgi:hypothetical protein